MKSLLARAGGILIDLAPTTESFAVLYRAKFREFFFGQSLSALGDALVPIALAFAVLDLTNSAAALGVVLLASRIPLTALTLLGGVIGDRLPRRAIMVVADLTRMAAHLATGTLLITGTAKLWHLIALQIIAGTASAFFTPAASGLVRNVVEPNDLKNANALLGLSRNTTAILAVVLSGTIVATIGPGWAFMLNGVTFGMSVFFLGRIKLPRHERVQYKKDLLRQLADGLTYVRERTWLVVSISYTAFLNGAVIAPILVLGPTIAKTSLGGAGSWAVIQAATGIGAIGGSVIALRIKPRRPLFTTLSAAFLILPFVLLLAIAAPTWLIAAGGFLFGVQSAFFGILFASTIQRAVSPDAIGRVTSYNSLGSLVLAPAGFALAGVYAMQFGARNVLLISAAWVAVSTVLVLLVPSVSGTDDDLAETDTASASLLQRTSEPDYL